MNREEAARRISNLDRLVHFFREHEGEWIVATELEKIAGRQAWRTRVSDARVKRHMNIENRVIVKDRVVVRSEYRYLSYTPLGRDASMPTVQKDLF